MTAQGDGCLSRLEGLTRAFYRSPLWHCKERRYRPDWICWQKALRCWTHGGGVQVPPTHSVASASSGTPSPQGSWPWAAADGSVTSPWGILQSRSPGGSRQRPGAGSCSTHAPTHTQIISRRSFTNPPPKKKSMDKAKTRNETISTRAQIRWERHDAYLETVQIIRVGGWHFG